MTIFSTSYLNIHCQKLSISLPKAPSAQIFIRILFIFKQATFTSFFRIYESPKCVRNIETCILSNFRVLIFLYFLFFFSHFCFRLFYYIFFLFRFLFFINSITKSLQIKQTKIFTLSLLFPFSNFDFTFFYIKFCF